METLEQIECRGCGETFHHRMLTFKIGDAGSYDMAKTCPLCGEENVDFVKVRVNPDADPYAGTRRYYQTRPMPFVETAMEKAMHGVVEKMRERVKKSMDKAMRGQSSPEPSARKQLK